MCLLVVKMKSSCDPCVVEGGLIRGLCLPGVLLEAGLGILAKLRIKKLILIYGLHMHGRSKFILTNESLWTLQLRLLLRSGQDIEVCRSSSNNLLKDEGSERVANCFSTCIKGLLSYVWLNYGLNGAVIKQIKILAYDWKIQENK